MVDGYTASYNVTQLSWAVTDLIGGIFDGLAGMSSVYGTALIALMILGALFLILKRVKV